MVEVLIQGILVEVSCCTIDWPSLVSVQIYKARLGVPRSLVLKFHFQLAIAESFYYSSGIIAS